MHLILTKFTETAMYNLCTIWQLVKAYQGESSSTLICWSLMAAENRTGCCFISLSISFFSAVEGGCTGSDKLPSCAVF